MISRTDPLPQATSMGKRRLWIVLSAMPGLLAIMIQVGPEEAGKNLCEWVAAITQTSSCPGWLPNIPRWTSLALWAMFIVGLVSVFWPQLHQLITPAAPSRIIHSQTYVPPHWIRRVNLSRVALLISIALIGTG